MFVWVPRNIPSDTNGVIVALERHSDLKLRKFKN